MLLKLLITFTSLACIGSQETLVQKDVSDLYHIYTTQAFYVQIPTDGLNKSMSPQDPYEFMPSILGMPDLPVWMQYRQLNHTLKAYLYGSPALNDDRDIDIEVISINQYNYETNKQIIKFRVNRRQKTAKYEVELKFVNLNIDDMFDGNRFDDVLQIFRDKLWKGSRDVYITKIASPVDVGGRLPLDPREKEGVIIRLGSIDNYTRDILDLEREVDRIKNRNPCPRKYKATTAEYMFRSKGFSSDWCSFQLIRPKRFKEGKSIVKSETLPSFTPKDDDNLLDNYEPFGRLYPRRDYTVDLVVCFVIPLLMAIMIISSLTCIFFYNNESKNMSHKCSDNPNIDSNETLIQLEQYNSISRASLRLRSLAHNRNTESLPESYSTVTSLPLPTTVLSRLSGTSTLPRAKSLSYRPTVMRAHSFHQMSAAIDTII